jgi:hypothetical protein
MLASRCDTLLVRPCEWKAVSAMNPGSFRPTLSSPIMTTVHFDCSGSGLCSRPRRISAASGFGSRRGKLHDDSMATSCVPDLDVARSYAYIYQDHASTFDVQAADATLTAVFGSQPPESQAKEQPLGLIASQLDGRIGPLQYLAALEVCRSAVPAVLERHRRANEESLTRL